MPSTDECCWHGIPLDTQCDECGFAAAEDEAPADARLMCVTRHDKRRW